MRFIIGKKIKMTQLPANNNDKHLIPVTLIKAGPCYITQIKQKDKDGYSAIQIGFEETKKLNKPLEGHLKKINKKLKYLKEFRVPNEQIDNKFKLGDLITVSIFKPGDKVKVTGRSKGKGFQGVIKRWHFRGVSRTHGTKHAHRQPGSIGIGGHQKVMKGKKMPGRAGNKTITIKNLEIINIDEKNNLIAIKGSIPGHRNSIVTISTLN